jgi:hypothetical protein
MIRFRPPGVLRSIRSFGDAFLKATQRNSQNQNRGIDHAPVPARVSFHFNSQLVARPKRAVILRFDWNFKVKLEFASGAPPVRRGLDPSFSENG